MAKLKRLHLEGLKSIREMSLELGPLNVLIGPNGAGKSNLLSFFRMLNALAEGNLQTFVGKQGGASSMLRYGRKRTPHLHARMTFDVENGQNTYSISLTGVAPDDLMFTDEVVVHEPRSGRRKETNLHGGHRESRLTDAIADGDKTAQTVKWSVDRWRVFHFHDTSAEAPIKQNCQLKDNRYLRADGANLAAFLYLLKSNHAAHYERIRSTVRMVAPFFDDFVLEPDALNPLYISLAWREMGQDSLFFAHHLSDGTLRFIALATVLLQPTDLPNMPHLVLIDEPELGLHPYAITLLASMMKAASTRTQLIVSTQSVNLLDELDDPSSVIVVERKEQSTFTRLDETKLESWLDQYSLGELWEKNVLGGRP